MTIPDMLYNISPINNDGYIKMSRNEFIFINFESILVWYKLFKHCMKNNSSQVSDIIVHCIFSYRLFLSDKEVYTDWYSNISLEILPLGTCTCRCSVWVDFLLQETNN